MKILKDEVFYLHYVKWVFKSLYCLPGDSSSIVGGEDTKPGQFPFMALLGVPGTDRRCFDASGKRHTAPIIKWNCGGTLINRWYIVTAAHCQVYQNSNPFADGIHLFKLSLYSVKVILPIPPSHSTNHSTEERLH